MQLLSPLLRLCTLAYHCTYHYIPVHTQVLSPLFVPPREYVTVQGQLGDCMYFIHRGIVQLTKLDDHSQERALRRLSDVATASAQTHGFHAGAVRTVQSA